MAGAIILRLIMTLTVVVGIGMYINALSVVSFRHVHMTLGILGALGALVLLRQTNGRRIGGISAHHLGRFAPLLPLAVGLGMLFEVSLRTMGIITLHGLLGLLAVGLVEMALGRRRVAETASTD